MSKLVTDSVFEGFVQQAMAMQHGALVNVVGCMKAFPGCDEVLMQSAKAEMRRLKREAAAFMSGRASDFAPLDRPLLARAWADWYVAEAVRDYGWVDCRTTGLGLPDGYGVSVRPEQDGVKVSVVDDRNPNFPSVVGSFRIDNAGAVWVGRHDKRAESPAAAATSIVAENQSFEADREARLAQYLGAA